MRQAFGPLRFTRERKVPRLGSECEQYVGKPALALSRTASGVLERGQQIRDQVVGVFDTDGQAYQSGIDADLFEIFVS